MPWKSLNIVSQDYHPPTVVESISYELWDAGLQDVVTQAEAEDGNICLVDKLSANTHTKCRYFICSFSPSKLQRMLVVSSSIGFIKALITPYIKLHSGMILSFLIQKMTTPPTPMLRPRPFWPLVFTVTVINKYSGWSKRDTVQWFRNVLNKSVYSISFFINQIMSIEHLHELYLPIDMFIFCVQLSVSL